ncbi:Response regulator receiver domain-containing protein [Methylobacterium phyllostachyos]|uniref:Response regulator receiver domain-containing protein n=1 Tax=Methylobacterium phyllostachyos TaxID=582672 RepID=A0A1H0LLC3_9HYPH|nr:response regulator [Methylobacterium phyllostachyos]SDO68954.1 Response regulator receiver domain-containing protein [Methylobacterium phyllostachyos]
MNSSAAALTGRRVLLVEDDYFIAIDLKVWFEEGGAEVLGPVPSVDEALALIADTAAIDAAVLDINLQDELVFPVADALHARGVPFLFATGYDAAVVPPPHGAVPLCQKPIDPRVVARALFG